MTIHTGDCLEVMRTFPDNHFTGIVCDPPYMLNFMSKEFDKFENNPAKSVELWQETLRIVKPGAHLLAFGGDRTHHHMMLAIENAGWEIRTCIYWCFGSGFPKSHNHFGPEGYGTALKPAVEIITVAMKPLDGTFKQNYEKWGIGGLNIDRCRIGSEKRINPPSHNIDREKWRMNNGADAKNCIGRWPANLILDEEAAEQLSAPSRFFYCAKASSKERNDGLDGFPDKKCHRYSEKAQGPLPQQTPSKGVIEKNTHPTVKPLSLMRYLITLIAPPQNALILDPFAGSGSTIVAAKQLGIEAIGIEKEFEYAEIARARVAATARKVDAVKSQMELFP